MRFQISPNFRYYLDMAPFEPRLSPFRDRLALHEDVLEEILEESVASSEAGRCRVVSNVR